LLPVHALATLRHMQHTQSRPKVTGEPDDLERELRDLDRVVATARRNRWFGGDVLEADFRPVLSGIVARRPLSYARGLRPGPEWREHRNRWRELLEQVG
jgi:hypothetical protein